MREILTKNEAKVLSSINVQNGSFLYELASAAELTLTEAQEAAERLQSRGYLSVEPAERFARITKDGLVVRNDISESSLSDPHLKFSQSYEVGPEPTAADASYDEMSETEVSEAIDAEIEKY
jgi:hypothetical protein